MRIIHATTFLQGGAGKIIVDLALHQNRNGHEVHIFKNKTEETGYCTYPEYLDILSKNGIKVHSVDSTFKRDIYQNSRAAGVLREIITDRQVDIIHAHAAIPALIGIIARSGHSTYIPVIQTQHGWGINKSVEQEQTDITVMRGLDKVIAVLETGKNFLLSKGIPASILHIIRNGIEQENVKSILPSTDNKIASDLVEIRRQGKRIIGCIGTVCDLKNQALLLEAIQIIPETIRPVCIFIGEGELISQLEEDVRNLGFEKYVIFYGYRERAEQYFQYFDCLVSPSKSEGLGLNVLEAFKMRIPVVLSDIPVFRELVGDSKCGTLFTSNDAHSLAEKLQQVLSTPKEVLDRQVECAHKEYLHLFTKEKMLDEYDRLYLSLLKNRKFPSGKQ